jgi:hypothetical protein
MKFPPVALLLSILLLVYGLPRSSLRLQHNLHVLSHYYISLWVGLQGVDKLCSAIPFMPRQPVQVHPELT